MADWKSAIQQVWKPALQLQTKALCASVGLSLLFLGVYGLCNWITSQRHDVGTLYFDWERFIPFVPWMFIPYFSIDLFFVAAPFLCRDEEELTVLCQRLLVATIAAGICFLLFPLKFAFQRPHVVGGLGLTIDWFRGMDLPYNLVPSLHIVYQTILVQHYARHTRGLWRAGSNLWFSLIAFSTLLTYQHHFLDVVAGFALGVGCIYFIPEPAPRFPLKRNRRIGFYYAAGAVITILLVIALWPWGAFLLWPTASLGALASAYFDRGPSIFRKNYGSLEWSARIVLAPCLLGQHLSLWYYKRQSRPWDKVTPNLWIGGVLNESAAAGLVEMGVTTVLDLTAEFSEAKSFRALVYRNVPILDLTAPSLAQLQEITSFIERQSPGGIVYCHCKIGYSRSAAAAAAYLLGTGQARDVAEAILLIRQARPTIIIRPEVIAVLEEFAASLPQFAEEI